MAWMKSASTGNWTLTAPAALPLTVLAADEERAKQISTVLGFSAVIASSEAIKAEQDRARTDYNKLVTDIAAATAKVVGAAPPATIDIAAIVAAITDGFAKLPDAILTRFRTFWASGN